MKKFIFLLSYSFVRFITLFPLGILYIVSDILGFTLYNIIRYRRKIVRQNLINSFPEKSISEIKEIEQEFYRWFCDVFIETIKLMNMPEEEMHRRMKFTNIELLQEYSKSGKNIFLMLGHYGNWEWVTYIGRFLPSEVVSSQIYHPLHNPYWEEFFLKLRGRFGSKSIKMKSAFREFITYKRQNQIVVCGFIADQSPKGNALDFQTQFLNQPTYFIIGAERIAKQLDCNLIYLDVKRTKRGHYEGTFQLMTDAPKEYPDFELTKQYAYLMENTIRRSPAYWLWTHKRWKHNN